MSLPSSFRRERLSFLILLVIGRSHLLDLGNNLPNQIGNAHLQFSGRLPYVM